MRKPFQTGKDRITAEWKLQRVCRIGLGKLIVLVKIAVDFVRLSWMDVNVVFRSFKVQNVRF